MNVCIRSAEASFHAVTDALSAYIRDCPAGALSQQDQFNLEAMARAVKGRLERESAGRAGD